MKRIMGVCIVLILVGCATVPAPPDSKAVPPAVPSNVAQLTVPNWPVYGYMADGAILILLVQDPATFPIPGTIRFSRADGSVVEMQIVNTQAEKK